MIDKKSVLKNLKYLASKSKSALADNAFVSLLDRKINLFIERVNNGNLDVLEKTEKCKWKYKDQKVNKKWYETDCDNTFFSLLCVKNELDFRFCPYCGKEIEEVGNEK